MKPPGKATEIRVLELVRRRKHFLAFSRIVQPEFFTSPATRRIYEEIHAFYQEHTIPRIGHVNLAALLNIKEPDNNVLAEMRKLILQMQRISGRINEVEVKNLVIQWTRRNLTKQALYEGLEQLETGNGMDLNLVRTKLDIASNIGSPETTIYDYHKLTADRVLPDPLTAPVGTGIPSIDELLEGGVDIGEIGLLIGPTHRGKTRSLVNIGANALKLGKHVVHIIVCDSTAKRIARRYDSILCNKLYSILRDQPEILEKKLAYIERRGGKLVLKEYDSFAPTPADIRHWLKEYIEFSRRKIDVLIIDYLDEMKSERRYKEFRFESRDLTSSIRRLSAEFRCPIWTASQGNRESFKKNIVGLDDVAEDISKSMIADIIITLNQTDEEKGENIIRYKLAKARRERFEPKMFFLETTEAGLIREAEFPTP